MGRYSKLHSNYILSKKHQKTRLGQVWERDWVTTGSQHQIEKGKKPYFSDTNFLFTDNSYPSYKKKHNYGKWVAHWNYDNVKNATDDVNTVKVNTTSNDIRDFAYYGSAVELVKSSITNIINWFPANVTLSSDNVYVPTTEGGYDILNGYKQLDNPFNIDFVHTLTDKDKEKYNVNRFLLNSWKNFQVNGSDITDYHVTYRKFYGKTQRMPRTVKYAQNDPITIHSKQILGENGEGIAIKYESVNLFGEELATNTLVIDDFDVNTVITSDFIISEYAKNEAKINTNYGTFPEYRISEPYFLKELNHTVNATLNVTGYGLKDEDRIIQDITVNNGRQPLKNIERYRWDENSENWVADGTVTRMPFHYDIENPGKYSYYTFLSDGSEEGAPYYFTITEPARVMPVYISYDNKRNVLLEDDINHIVIYNGDELFRELDYQIYSRDKVTGNINGDVNVGIGSFTIFEEINGVKEHKYVVKNINVNNSRFVGTYTFDGNYKLRVINSIGSETKELTNYTYQGELFFNQSTRRFVYNNDSEEVFWELNTFNLEINDFTLYIIKESNPIEIEYHFDVKPCESLNLEPGKYFLEYYTLSNGVLRRQTSPLWYTKCYNPNESPKEITKDIDRIRVYGINIEVITVNDEVVSFDSFETNEYKDIVFYKQFVTSSTYTFMQCASDEEYENTYKVLKWAELDCRPTNWLPTLTMRVDYDVAVGECTCGGSNPNCHVCDGEGCYVTVPVTGRLSWPVNPFYGIYITTENGNNYELGGYIINNEEVLITETNREFRLTPKKDLFDDYFNNIDGFEKQLLTLDTNPVYKNSFLTPIEGELTYKYVYRDYTWPSEFDDDLGYAYIDISSESYMSYLSNLIDMATVFDELWCDNLYKNMTHEAIKNFDWTFTKDYNEGDEQDNIDGGNQIMKLLRVYGRAFDDIKRLVDGIGYTTKNTYDGYVNEPDAEISDRLEEMGWDITSTIPNFNDTDQGYVNTTTGEVITKKEFDDLTEEEKTEYKPAYINNETSQIIGLTNDEYNRLASDIKKWFTPYYPAIDLSNVTIDDDFITDYITKYIETNNTDEKKWFDSSNNNTINTSSCDIDFVRKLLLSSSRIFNTKGTQQAIDMVMGMFGFGRGLYGTECGYKDDYELTEGYYYITENELKNKEYDKKPVIDGEESDLTNAELVESINYYKDYPKYYDDIYSGIPLNDIFMLGHDENDNIVKNKHYIVPFYSQSRVYDGDFIFESKGGWGKHIKTGSTDYHYTETLSYLHVVSDFSELLNLNPSSLNDGDIYYVVSIASYSEYVSVLPDNMSHFFVLNEYGKYNPQLPESWGNVNMDDVNNENTKKAIYLNNLLSSNFGNNPHIGYGTYDDGCEFRSYMEKPFKYAIDEYLLDNEWYEKAEEFTYEIKCVPECPDCGETDTTENGRSTDTEGEDTSDKSKIKIIIDYPKKEEETTNTVTEGTSNNLTRSLRAGDTEDPDSIFNYYINRKYFLMENKIEDNFYKKYFMDVIVKYLMQVIPSTTLLVLKNFEYNDEAFEIKEYGDLSVTLLYPDIIPFNGGSVIPIIKYSQEVTMKDGTKKTITPELTSIVYSGSGTGFTLNTETGEVSAEASTSSDSQRSMDVTVTITSSMGTSEPKVATYTNQVRQDRAPSYGEIEASIEYRNKIPCTDNGTVVVAPTPIYSLTIVNPDGSVKNITSGAVIKYVKEIESEHFEIDSTSGIVRPGSVGVNTDRENERVFHVKAVISIKDETTGNIIRKSLSGIPVYQEVNKLYGYSDISITQFDYGCHVYANGTIEGSDIPIVVWEQDAQYMDGSHDTIYCSNQTNTCEAVISYTGKYIDNVTGLISGVNTNNLFEEIIATDVSVYITANGKTGSANYKIMQDANEVSDYGNDLYSTLYYEKKISAKGSETEEVFPTLNYEYQRYFTNGTYETITNSKDAIIEYELSPEYSRFSSALDSSTGRISYPFSKNNRQEDVVLLKVRAKITVNYILNGVNSQKTYYTDYADVLQEANEIIGYGDIIITEFRYTPNITASGKNGNENSKSNPTLRYQQDIFNSNGETQTRYYRSATGNGITYTSKINNVDSSSGKAGVFFAYGPNPDESERTIDYSTISINLNGKNKTGTSEIKQDGQVVFNVIWDWEGH